MNKILIRNGTILSPSLETPFQSDILIEEGIIREIAPRIEASDAQVFEAQGKTICPGFVDLEAHILRSLQDVEKAIIAGTREAVKGGFTTLCAMSDTNPPLDNEGMIGFIRFLSQKQGSANVIPVACATKGLKGETMAEIGTLVGAGAGLIYDAGKTITDTLLLRQIMEYSKMFEVPLFLHCEDPRLSKDGLINEGEVSTRMGLPGIPCIAEEVIVARDLLLCEYTGRQIHFPHITTRGSLRLIKTAKERGVKVTCSVTPHHLDLTDRDIKSFDTNFKITPPLRSEEDRISLISGLKDGTIDAIATCHTPCSPHSKDLEFAEAPFGITGLETAFMLLYERLVQKEGLPLPLLIRKLTEGPLTILNIKKSLLTKGSEADLTILNLDGSQKLTSESMISKYKNTPYLGREFKGIVDSCMVKGVFRYKEGQLL